MPEQLAPHIAGKHIPAVSGDIVESLSPTTGQVLATSAGPKDADVAVDVARRTVLLRDADHLEAHTRRHDETFAPKDRRPKTASVSIEAERTA